LLHIFLQHILAQVLLVELTHKQKIEYMTNKALIALSFVMMALLIDNACSVYDTTGLSADQVIDESNGIYAPTGIPENPQESRDIWSKESGVDFTKPGNQSNQSTDMQAESSTEGSDSIRFQKTSELSSTSTTSAINTTNKAGTTGTVQSASTTASAQNAASTTPSGSFAGIAVEWILELRDSKTRQLGLTLVRSEDAIYGEGTMNDGSSTLPVLASGSIHNDSLQMDVVSSGNLSLYRFALKENGGTLSGDYKAFSAGTRSWTGIAKGMRTA